MQKDADSIVWQTEGSTFKCGVWLHKCKQSVRTAWLQHIVITSWVGWVHVWWFDVTSSTEWYELAGCMCGDLMLHHLQNGAACMVIWCYIIYRMVLHMWWFDVTSSTEWYCMCGDLMLHHLQNGTACVVIWCYIIYRMVLHELKNYKITSRSIKGTEVHFK